MKTVLKLFLSGLFLFIMISGNALAQPDTLVIVHINDTHSHLVPYGPKDSQDKGSLGGVARTSTLIKQIKATENNVLLLHAGDVFTGDFMSNKYHIVPELQFFIDMGFDALTIGNHEFDRTPETLKRALREAGFPRPDFDILSANLDMSQEPELAELVKPYTIKTVGNLKVGIFGLTIESTTNTFSHPHPVIVTDYLKAGQAAVDSLRSQCDILIALTHLGFELDSTLAQTVSGIDIIVGGHDHLAHFTPRAVINPEGKTTWIVRAGCFYDYVGFLKLAYSSPDLNILDYRLIPVDTTVAADPMIEATVQILIDSLQADPRYGPVYDDIVAEAAVDIERTIGRRYKDSSIGNLITDAFRDATGTDIAIDANGFIRQKIFKGPLTGSDIFQAISDGFDPNTGYGFNLVTFQLSGVNLKFGLAYTAIECQENSDMYIQVSGLDFMYDSRFPSLILVIKSLNIGGQPYKLDSLYTITSSDELAAFLGLAGLEPIDLQPTGLTEYEVVRDYMIANSSISYYSEGRIQDVSQPTSVESSESTPIATTFKLHQNYPNPFSLKSGNGGTKIRYYLPMVSDRTASVVTLKVYNILGEEVTTLLNESQQGGLHTVKWQGRDSFGVKVSNGIYFYRLKSGGRVLTRKMLILR